MVDLLNAHAARLAAWVPVASIVVAVACVASLFFLRAARPGDQQPLQRRLGRLARHGLVFAAVALFVSLGPMKPLFVTARQLDNELGSAPLEVEFRPLESPGEVRRLDELRGQVVVVNLWATYCPPCLVELPVLNRLQAAYRDRGLVVVTLTDETPERAGEVIARLAPDALNATVDDFGGLTIESFRPFTLILDREGALRDYFFGSQDYATFEERIGPHL